ncbi:hypothetical protein RYX36_037290, partial [Vicia faba]
YERFCSQPPSLVTHLRSSLNNLQQLRVLDLHSNELWADIGDLLPTLRNLEFLDLSQNQFYGGLSITLENVSSLANTVRFLNVSHNKLNGNFFLKDAIGLFRNLQALDLSDNMIRGELPSFVSLRELRVLKLASNIFFGAVPEDLLLTSMSLEELNLSSNGFTGSIGQMKILRQERHTVCFIEFEDLTSATNVHQNLQGAVIPISAPTEPPPYSSINYQTFDSSSSNNLPFLPLPQNKTPNPYTMLHHHHHHQQQHRRHRHGQNQTRNLRTKTEQSRCPLGPRQQTPTRSTVRRRTLSQNPRRTLRRTHRHLRLRQPSQIFHLLSPISSPSYERFCSQPPSLVTHLRSSLNNLQQLRVLDLHSNELWADIGDLLPTLRNLEFLDLSQNQFYGGLSITLENVSSLANTVRFLNVSHNKLNGNFFLKDAIGLFRNLQALDLSDNMIRGELPSFVSLRELRVLKLASNIFFGAVPEDLLLTSMSLEELNLSSNGFTGSIGVINSTTINILDLSSNSLSSPFSFYYSCTTISMLTPHSFLLSYFFLINYYENTW